MTYGTHTLDTELQEYDNMRDWLEFRGLRNPNENQIRAALNAKSDPYLAALRAQPVGKK